MKKQKNNKEDIVNLKEYKIVELGYVFAVVPEKNIKDIERLL